MEMRVHTRGSWARFCIVLVIGAWMIMGPAYRQVFDGKSKLVPRWVMFHGFGRAVCDVRFFQFVKDGEGEPLRQPLDRFEVLEKRRDWATNKSLVRMSSKADVQKVGQRLCRALGSGADVRALARCGSRGRWKGKLNLKTKLCKTDPFNRRFRPGDYR